MTLLEFIEARLGDVEALALAATPGPWRYNPNKQWLPHADKTTRDVAALVGYRGDEFVGAGPLAATVGVAVTGPADDPQSMADARFIARHDPARVLREVEAKRRLLALHLHLRYTEPLDADSDFEEDHRPAFAEPPLYVGCKTCHYDARHEETYPSWWCDTVRLLALPYSDHVDYRQEWAP